MGDITQTPIRDLKSPETWVLENLQSRVEWLEKTLEFLIQSCPEAQRFMREYQKQEKRKR
jgi:hypothetical protein